MKKIVNVVKCPNCGYEYMPAEVYYPKSFFGKPDVIIRDDNGHIQDYVGTDMDLQEKYVCDKCGRQFTATAYVKFQTKPNKKLNFQEQYISKIK